MRLTDKKNRLLVTGASGFIGSHIAEYLLNKGFIVYGAYHSRRDGIKFLKSNKNFIPLRLDLTEYEKVKIAFKKIKPDCVFHAAALHSPRPIDSPHPFFNANVASTLNVLEACRFNKINKIINSSSMSVYGTKVKRMPVGEQQPADVYDFYSLSKKLAEDLCAFYSKKFQLKIIVFRYVGVFGPRRSWGAVYNFTENALAGHPLIINGNVEWDIIPAGDVARANYQAYLKADQLNYSVINIGRGKTINIFDLAKKICTYSDSKSRIDIKFKAGKAYRFYVKNKKAEKLLGFKPSDFNRELRRYIKSMASLK